MADGLKFKNRPSIVELIEIRNMQEGTDIKGNVQHFPFAEDNHSSREKNILKYVEDLSELPSGEEIFTMPKIGKPTLNVQECSNVNTLYIDAFADVVSTKAESQTISSNIQHLPLVGVVQPKNRPDIQKVVQDIQSNAVGDIRNLPDKAGVIQKNSIARALNDVAASLSRMLRFMVYRKMLCLWIGYIWAVLDPTSFITVVRESLPDEPLVAFLSIKSYDEIYKMLLTDPNLQVADEDVKRPAQLVAFNDGVIDVLTGQRMVPNPQHFCFTFINMPVKEVGQGEGTVFEKYMDSSTGGDWRIRQRILEMIGVVVSGYMLKSIFLIMGPKNSGKSQLILLLRLLVGAMNCESLNSLNEFSERWTTGRLLGKKLCICPEVPKERINAQAVSIMKQLVGGDLVSGDQKYKMPFSFVNEAKLVFASNHRLQIVDAESETAFLGRIIAIPFINSIPQDQMIPGLCNLLILERGYIIAHAIEALRDLQRRNFAFTEVEVPAFYEDLLPASDNIIDFCEEKCILNSDSECATGELYEAYLAYCNEIGIQPEALAVFARTISSKFPELEHLRKVKGTPQRGFRGIALMNSQST